MADLEKVIKALECCLADLNECKLKCKECQYSFKKGGNCFTKNELYKDALALLKAQKPVMVEEMADTDTINCPKCGRQFARVGCDKSIYLDTNEEPNYCPKCGQAVKWE